MTSLKSFKWYNLYNLEHDFKSYLLAGKNKNENTTTQEALKYKKVTIKNYLSDFRHFAGWVESVKKELEEGSLPQWLEVNLRAERITDYKKYLLENNIPLKTVNRRLSTIRKFCSFCIFQGWLEENPAKQVSNVSRKKRNIYQDALEHFSKDHLDENYLISDVNEFLEILSSWKK